MQPTLTPVPGATPRYDDDGNELVDVCTCGTCGRSWNDAAVSSVTPVPAGRCPFEYEHDDPDDDPDTPGWEPAQHVAAVAAYLIASAYTQLADVLNNEPDYHRASELSRAYDNLARAYQLVAGRRIGD